MTERLLHVLWDAGFQVGHATRNVAGCISLAESDMRVRTALLDARFLCGDFALYEDFEKKVESHLLKMASSVSSARNLRKTRRVTNSTAVRCILLEPEVKEGEGGLRDIQTARWIARAKLKAKDLDALALTGIVSTDDIARLKESQDFLLRVRNELHFSTGKHQDQLTFEQQENVSCRFGLRRRRQPARGRGVHAHLLSARGADQPAFGADHSPRHRLRETALRRCICIWPNFTRGDSLDQGSSVR